jgi:hypothetical protein
MAAAFQQSQNPNRRSGGWPCADRDAGHKEEATRFKLGGGRSLEKEIHREVCKKFNGYPEEQDV